MMWYDSSSISRRLIMDIKWVVMEHSLRPIDYQGKTEYILVGGPKLWTDEFDDLRDAQEAIRHYIKVSGWFQIDEDAFIDQGEETWYQAEAHQCLAPDDPDNFDHIEHWFDIKAVEV
jgi:hypothetical protein